MKLQILVPQYNEDQSIVKRLLDSIANQVCVDFNEIGVVIVNDGNIDATPSREFLNSYPFVVKLYNQVKHKGVSATRNSALMLAHADYVMFCDADDMFYKVSGLFTIFREIDKGFDMLISSFIEEWHHPETGEIKFLDHTADTVFVHGKVFRREYLFGNRILWNEQLTVHEDSYFNTLAASLSDNVKYFPNSFYLWCWRDNSVCRHDPKYMLKTYGRLIDSNDALVDEFLKRELPDKAEFYTAFMIFEAYYTMNKPEWIEQDNVDYRKVVESRFQEYFNKHKNLWKALPEETRRTLSAKLRDRNLREGMMIEQTSIYDWLKYIEEL